MVHQHRVHSDGIQWAIKKGKIVAAPTYSPRSNVYHGSMVDGTTKWRNQWWFPCRFLKASTSREDQRYRG
jgi:hypothetical protein